MTTFETRTQQSDFWKRFRKNKLAVAGLGIIIIAFVVAAFAYSLAPDQSPNANTIIVEIGGRSAGFTQTFLKIPSENMPDITEGPARFFSGERYPYTLIPINTYSIVNDSLVADQYIDEGVSEKITFPLQNIIPRGASPDYSPVTAKKFYLGTDQYGRDILSRLIIGIRVSLAVGFITVIISLSIGILLGALAGYFRGWVDDIVMWFINILWSIPTLLLVFAITLMLGKGFWQVFIAIGLTMWVNVARIVRGQVLAVRQLEYIEAATALGFSHTRIIVRHILPNIMGPVIVVAASNFASAIVIEAGLSFLGVGVQPPQPSWGLMVKENYNFIITNNPMLAIYPGIAIMTLVLAFNLLGNGLRDALQVKN